MSPAPAFIHQVVYADTDAGGVMYHGRYFDLAERSRNAALAARHALLSRIQVSHDLVFVVNRVQARYQRPALLDDTLCVASHVLKCSPARVVWQTEVARGSSMLARLVVHTAGVRLSRRELCLIPEDLLSMFASLLPQQAKELQ